LRNAFSERDFHAALGKLDEDHFRAGVSRSGSQLLDLSGWHDAPALREKTARFAVPGELA